MRSWILRILVGFGTNQVGGRPGWAFRREIGVVDDTKAQANENWALSEHQNYDLKTYT
jgi:hypothetical protein